MSFVDTVGPFIFLTLLGLAILIAAVAWIGWWLLPHIKMAAERRLVTNQVLAFNREAKALIDMIAGDKLAMNTVSSDIALKVWELEGIKQPKGIS